MNDATAADTENEGEAAHARATEQSENRQSALYERPLKPRTDGKTTAAKVETLAEQQRQVDILYQRLWNQQPRVSNQTKPC
jgi:putative lipoic acid-binding regulatory protein